MDSLQAADVVGELAKCPTLHMLRKTQEDTPSRTGWCCPHSERLAQAVRSLICP